MSGERDGLYIPTGYLRGRSGCWRDGAEHPDAYASAAAELVRALVRLVRFAEPRGAVSYRYTEDVTMKFQRLALLILLVMTSTLLPSLQTVRDR